VLLATLWNLSVLDLHGVFAWGWPPRCRGLAWVVNGTCTILFASNSKLREARCGSPAGSQCQRPGSGGSAGGLCKIIFGGSFSKRTGLMFSGVGDLQWSV